MNLYSKESGQYEFIKSFTSRLVVNRSLLKVSQQMKYFATYW